MLAVHFVRMQRRIIKRRLGPYQGTDPQYPVLYSIECEPSNRGTVTAAAKSHLRWWCWTAEEDFISFASLVHGSRKIVVREKDS